MNAALFVLLPAILASFCLPAKDKEEHLSSEPRVYFITQEDAEKILGQKVLNKGSSYERSKASNYGHLKSTFTAVSPDTQTQKTSNLYYSLEHFADSAQCQKAYDNAISSNGNSPGHSELSIGTQSHFHTDGVNFYFLMARKGIYFLKMKVNKVTSLTSEQELKNVAAKIISLIK